MKKFLLIFGIVILVLLAALFIVPVIFKDTLIEKTKTTINRNINAEVDFEDLSLSIFRNFPNVTVVINDMAVTGKGEFQNDTLLKVNSAGLTMSLLSLIGQSETNIEEIELIDPYLNLMVNKQENANWDIVQTAEPQGEETGTIDLQLDEIIIRNGQVVYDDRAAGMLLVFDAINLNLEGEMYGTSAKLNADGRVGRMNLNYDGSNFISNVSLETKTLVDINYETMNIEIVENELYVNRLPVVVTGAIKAPGDTIWFDLNFQTKESGFENFLALIPPDYEEYLEGLETEGKATLNGAFEGYYFEETYPALSMDLDVSNGRLHYEDLPEEITNIRADATIRKPQGGWDLTQVVVSDAHAEIGNNPVDFSLTLKNLVSDPWFDASLVGLVDLANLKDALPLDSVNMSGTIDANLFVQGSYSAIEKEQYQKIKSEGVVVLNDYTFESNDLTQPVHIPEGRLDFSPENINLSQFQMRIGQSDFNLSGKVSNYLNYYFADGNLKGNMQLNSKQVNLNELFRLQADQGEIVEEESESMAFNVPSDIDFVFRSAIERALYDDMQISDINGLITVQNGKLVLNDLNMNMLDGQLTLTGSYENTEQNHPLFDFGLNITSFGIPEAASTISGIQQKMPIVKNSQGSFSSIMKINGQFNEALKLMMPTVDGSGVLTTNNLEIVNSPVLAQIGGLLNKEKLKNVYVDDFKATFTIDNGNLVLKPFTTRIAGQETKVTGMLNTENLLDMRLDFMVQRDAFGSEIQNIINVLPGQENIKTIPASVVIKGPVNNPEVNIDLAEARKTITNEVKKSTQEDLQKTIDKVGEGLKKIFR